MIQISPQMEPAPSSVPSMQERRFQESGLEEGSLLEGRLLEGAAAEESQKDNTETVGTFAKILAGLMKKTGTGESVDAGAKNSDASEGREVPLAEKKSGEQTVSGKEKGIHVKADEPEKITKNKLKNSETESDLSPLGLSEQEKNVLLAVGRFAGQEEGLSPGETEEAHAGEHLMVDVRRFNRDNGKIGTTFTETAKEKGAEQAQTVSTTAFSAGELTKNRETSGEKAKNRLNAAEMSVKNRLTSSETGEKQQVEVKKVVSDEKKRKTKLEEARDRRRGLSFEVQDLRSGESASKAGAQIRVGAESRVSGENAGKEITLELRLPHNGPESSSLSNAWDVKSGQAFEDLLARELHQNFNNDIVRHASIALRNDNEGTIRLALKPESLGNVKIRLEMAENKITGHIVVETEEALRAFEREISSLEKAFRDSGFEGANLEMSLAADGGADQNQPETEASRFQPVYAAASRYDAQQVEIPLTLDIYQQGTRAVNMLV